MQVSANNSQGEPGKSIIAEEEAGIEKQYGGQPK